MSIAEARRTARMLRHAPARTGSGPGEEPGRRDLLVVLPLVALVLAASLVRLGAPPRYAFDEAYHAYTAGQYLAGNPDAHVWYARPPQAPVEREVELGGNPRTAGLEAELAAYGAEQQAVGYTWNHPPLGLWLIASGIAAWGDTAVGWRLAPALFGALGTALAYLLALSLTRNRLVAALTAALLPLSGLWLALSRIAMLDVFLAVFATAALLFLHRFLVSPPEEARWPLLLSGAFLGLAAATKWSALYPAALVLLVVLWRLYTLRRTGRTGRRGAEAPPGYEGLRLWAPVALVALPLALYLLAYAPFFAAGHAPGEWLRQQAVMLDYHRTLTGIHPYQSAWWSWPLMLVPVRLSAEYGDTTMSMTHALGNPLLFWAFVPAVLGVCWRLWSGRNVPALTVLTIGFLGQWLPWMLVPRSAFLYHFLPAVPFGCLAVAVLVADGWRRGGVWRIIAIGYVLAVVGAFASFYPILAGLPLTPAEYEARMWLGGWR